MHSSRWIQVMAALSLAFSLTAQASRADDFRLLKIGSLHVKWGAAVLGQGAGTVTYGFVRSPSSFPGARNCPTMVPADGIAAAADVDRRRFEALAAAAFDLWSGAANIAFRPAQAGETPDILIGAQGNPHGIAFADVRNDRARAVSGVAPLTIGNDLPQPHCGLDRRRPRARRPRPRDGAGARDRACDRPRPPGPDRDADGLSRPG